MKDIALKKGYITLETLFSLLPALLIVFITFLFYTAFVKIEQDVRQEDIKYKLFLISEYIVKDRAVSVGGVKYINWINESSLEVEERIIKKLNFNELYVGFSQKGDVCIYRIVVYGSKKEIKKLFICSS